jgi:hypothetical protein
MRKVKKRKIGAILGAFVVVIACVFSCILPSTVKKETASADSGIDSSQYESANLLNYSSFYSNGITVERLPNFTLYFYGLTTSTVYYSFSSFSQENLESGNYTLSGFNVGVGTVYVEAYLGDEWVKYLRGGDGTFSVNWEEGYSSVNIVYVIERDVNVNENIYPMLNKGTTAYPFMPNLNYFYNQGYDAGESEGLGTAAAGFMYGASISGTLVNAYIDDNQSEDRNIVFGPYTDITYIDSGLSFQQFTSYFESLAPYGWSKTEFNYTFANPVPYQLLQIVGAGNSTSFLSQVIATDTKGLKYTANWALSGDLYVLSLPDVTASKNIEIVNLYFSWGGGPDGLDVSIYEKNSKYLGGFVDGYNVGRNDGFIAGEVEGAKDQYDFGYSVGFTEGKLSVDPNSLSNSIRTFIFSLFDAPFAVIEPFIELDVLGIDLGGIFSLILLVGLVSFVFKVI